MKSICILAVVFTSIVALDFFGAALLGLDKNSSEFNLTLALAITWCIFQDDKAT